MRPFLLLIPDEITPAWFKAMVLQLAPGEDDSDAEQKARMEVERQFSDELAGALRGQMNDLIPPTASDQMVEDAVGRVGDTSGPVRDVLRRHLARGADLGVAVAFDTLGNVGLAFDWTQAHTNAAQFASQYSYELVRMINDTTRDHLQREVSEWFTNDRSLGYLRQQLEPTFGARRAQMIATTETTRAAYEGNMLGYEESGVVKESEWVTVNDERVCPTCGPLNGKRAPLRAPFPGGVDLPAHVNCRCFVRPVVEGVKKPKPAPGGPQGAATLSEGQEKIIAKEQQIYSQRYESAYATHDDGAVMVNKDGEKSFVAFDDAEIRLMRGTRLTHNHPSGWDFSANDPRHVGNSFSKEDLQMATNAELAEIRAITPVYTYSMKPPAGGWNTQYWNDILRPSISAIEDEIRSEFFANIRAGKMTPADAEAAHFHELWTRISAKHGLVYQRVEHGYNNR